MTGSHDITALKHEARLRARSARATVEAGPRAEASRALSEAVLALPELAGAPGILLAYAALPEEIDPVAAVAALLDLGWRSAYPRVESPGVLGLHLATERELAEGRFSVREPRPDAPRVRFGEVDVVLVPGVAFDEQGFRLGYGGGYYDRLLPQLDEDAFRVGLAFDEQVVDELPCEEHDVRLDAIVTPSRSMRFARGT